MTDLGVRKAGPVKVNMPIWFITCSQEPGQPLSFRAAYKSFRIWMMRSAMTLTSAFHAVKRAGSFRIVLQMRAPYPGGLEYVVRITIFNWDFNLVACNLGKELRVHAMQNMAAL